MNTQSLSRIITGLLILLVGVGAWLDSLNVYDLWGLAGTWWPVGVAVAGLLIFIGDRRQYITALALLVVGVVLQLNELDVIAVNVWSLVWPVIIIAVGLSVLINRSNRPKLVKGSDYDAISAVFAGTETINKSQDYKGGRVSAIFGGIELDLRDAAIKKEATIEVFALCGGVEIKIPREWKVEHRVTPILGGVESTKHSEKTTGSSPTLYIVGTVALGGVEIKS